MQTFMYTIKVPVGLHARHAGLLVKEASKYRSDIMVSFGEKTADATVILISHRIQTLMAADRILVMADGEIVEQGNHAELLSEGGIYKKIYDIQTGAEGGEA